MLCPICPIIFGLLFLTIELESVDREDKNRRDRVEPGPSEQKVPQNDMENMPFDDFLDDLFTLPKKHVENMPFDDFLENLFQTNNAHAKPQIPTKSSTGKQRTDQPSTSRFNLEANRAKQTQTLRTDQLTTHQTDQSLTRGKGIAIGRQIPDQSMPSRINTEPKRNKQTQTRRIEQPTTHQTDRSLIRPKSIVMERQFSDRSMASDQSTITTKDIVMGKQTFADESMISTNEPKQRERKISDQSTNNTKGSDQSTISAIEPRPMIGNRKLKEKQADPGQSSNPSRSKTEPMGQKQTKRQLNDQSKFTRTKSDLLENNKQTEKQKMSRSNSEPAKRAYPKIKIIFPNSKYKELSKVIENKKPQSAGEEPKTDEEKRQIVHQFIELKKKYLHLTDQNCDLPFIEMEERIAGEMGFQRSTILSWKKEFDKNKKQKMMPIDATAPPIIEKPAPPATVEEDEISSSESSADESASSLYEEDEESENDGSDQQNFSNKKSPTNKKRRSVCGGKRYPLKNWKQLINEYYSIKNAQNISDKKIAEQLGFSKMTLYKYKKKHAAECVAEKHLPQFQNEDFVSKMEKLSTTIKGKAPMMDKRSANKVKIGGGTSVAKKLKIGTSAGSSSSKAQKIDEKQHHDKGTKIWTNEWQKLMNDFDRLRQKYPFNSDAKIADFLGIDLDDVQKWRAKLNFVGGWKNYEEKGKFGEKVQIQLNLLSQ